MAMFFEAEQRIGHREGQDGAGMKVGTRHISLIQMHFELKYIKTITTYCTKSIGFD